VKNFSFRNAETQPAVETAGYSSPTGNDRVSSKLVLFV